MHCWEREIVYTLVDLRVYSPLPLDHGFRPWDVCITYWLVAVQWSYISLHALLRAQPFMKCNTDANLHRQDVHWHMCDSLHEYNFWCSLYAYSMAMPRIICVCRHLTWPTNPTLTLWWIFYMHFFSVSIWQLIQMDCMPDISEFIRTDESLVHDIWVHRACVTMYIWSWQMHQVLVKLQMNCPALNRNSCGNEGMSSQMKLGNGEARSMYLSSLVGGAAIYFWETWVCFLPTEKSDIFSDEGRGCARVSVSQGQNNLWIVVAGGKRCESKQEICFLDTPIGLKVFPIYTLLWRSL